MKFLNAALIIALLLSSGVALAERGSDEDNRIVYSGSTSTDSGNQDIPASQVLSDNPWTELSRSVVGSVFWCELKSLKLLGGMWILN